MSMYPHELSRMSTGQTSCNLGARGNELRYWKKGKYCHLFQVSRVERKRREKKVNIIIIWMHSRGPSMSHPDTFHFAFYTFFAVYHLHCEGDASNGPNGEKHEAKRGKNQSSVCLKKSERREREREGRRMATSVLVSPVVAISSLCPPTSSSSSICSAPSSLCVLVESQRQPQQATSTNH